MIVAHGPISYLANEKIQKRRISQLKLHEQGLVAILSLFFGILPDFDLFLLSTKNIPAFIHHNIITHTPFFYILIWILLKILISPVSRVLNKKFGNIFNKNLLDILTNAFLIGTLFHLLADFLVTSIMLFYPITNTKLYLLKYIFEPNLFTGYSLSPLFAIEILFVAWFVYCIYKKFFQLTRIILILLKSLIGISLICLGCSIYVSLNTYNGSYSYDVDGNINLDQDFDSLEDSLDMDVGNSGESNILKIDEYKLLDSTLDIVNSKKWASSKRDNIMYKLGGFDSYRLISQAFFNCGLPIEPVLRDFNIKKYGFDSYQTKYMYTPLLYEYLSEEKQLIELNLDTTVTLDFPKIFFLIDKNGEIINLGITLEGNYLAIVLENDNLLEMHSYKTVRKYYDKELSKIYIEK